MEAQAELAAVDLEVDRQVDQAHLLELEVVVAILAQVLDMLNLQLG